MTQPTANRILAVDDSRMMLRLIRGAIEALGFQPLEAANGREALELLADHSQEVALILLDWNMPLMNGIETLHALKGRPDTAHIPVMMVTTESEGMAVVEAIRAGAAHYVTKPFTPQDLILRMMECLGRGLEL
jgi:two-component system, chemotaxis family, chemotaxis protein CheY